MEALIVYYLVSLIRLVISGIFTPNIIGSLGGIVVTIAHGLCSSGLLCLANIYYEHSVIWRFYVNKSVITPKSLKE